MDITISPGKLTGQVNAVPSKSQAHRVLLCAALSDRPTRVEISSICNDLIATIGCIQGFGGKIEHEFGRAEIISPISVTLPSAICPCGESGATLRFFLPLAGALGIDTLFLLEGRLPYRPLSPLWEELERHGCKLTWVSRTQLQSQMDRVPPRVTAGLRLTGKLHPGRYCIDGHISSQFTSGLLMALPLLDGESKLEQLGNIESQPYIDMTLQVLHRFGVDWVDFSIPGNCSFVSPSNINIEGDWSNAAFWLCANAFGSQVTVNGLDPNSVQGDRVITDYLSNNDRQIELSAANIPDLVPILAVVGAAGSGAIIHDIQRLRLKESDRVSAIVDMICSLGGKAFADEQTLTVYPVSPIGGTVDSKNDHRIAMAAAIASTVCTRPVSILNAECVSKSYPNFWKEFTRLGGKI